MAPDRLPPPPWAPTRPIASADAHEDLGPSGSPFITSTRTASAGQGVGSDAADGLDRIQGASLLCLVVNHGLKLESSLATFSSRVVFAAARSLGVEVWVSAAPRL